MVLCQVFVTIISSLPYGMQLFYSNLTSTCNKHSLWLAIDTVIIQTSRMFLYGNSVSAFCIYVITSKEIQSMIKKGFRKLFSTDRQRNRVLLYHNTGNYEMRQIRN
jgi:hypothetical protein